MIMSKWFRCSLFIAAVASYSSTSHAVLVTVNGSTVFKDTFEASPTGNLAGHATSPRPGTWSARTDGGVPQVVDLASPGAFNGTHYAQVSRTNAPAWAVANWSSAAVT